jgi:hypothetical protein
VDARVLKARGRCAACRALVLSDPRGWNESVIGVVCAQCRNAFWAEVVKLAGASTFPLGFSADACDAKLREWAFDRARSTCATGCGATTERGGWTVDVVGVVCSGCMGEAHRAGKFKEMTILQYGVALLSGPGRDELRDWAYAKFDARHAVPWHCMMPCCRGRENNPESRGCYACGTLRPCAAPT